MQVPPQQPEAFGWAPTPASAEPVLDGGTPSDDAMVDSPVVGETDVSGPWRRADRGSLDRQWRYGIAAWRAGDYAQAAQSFEAVASFADSAPWGASAGAFWAARAHLFNHQPEEFTRWLTVAAGCRGTFYGLLARRILGMPMPFQWTPTDADDAAMQALNDSPTGQSIIALLQSGELSRAEREARAAATAGSPEIAHGAMIMAEVSGKAELAFRLSRYLSTNYGIQFDPAAYPIPRWQPEGGFTTDRALIYALMRQESQFDPGAVSPAGARGVMQLMPGTARFVTRVMGMPKAGVAQLHRPETNILIGQRYLEYLLSEWTVNGDLFRLAAAWNGGPANLERWQQQPDVMTDPLLFIESIPFGETRAFVERVLANLWIYRDRLGQASASLDDLASGQWPTYDGFDERTRVEVAEHDEE